MRKYTRIIAIVAAIAIFGTLYCSISNDYDTCRANGNSEAMCTGRG